MGDRAKYRRILTGTYISNSPFDAYAQFLFLDKDIFSQSFYAFKAEYAEIMDKNSPMIQNIMKKSGSRFAPMLVEKDKDGRPKYKNLDKLKALIAPWSMRVTKEQCLSLPPKIYEKRHFQLETTQQRMYNQLRDKMKTELLDSKMTVLHKMTLILRLSKWRTVTWQVTMG
jgi:SNF2 family DNA or RNA helicase